MVVISLLHVNCYCDVVFSLTAENISQIHDSNNTAMSENEPDTTTLNMHTVQETTDTESADSNLSAVQTMENTEEETSIVLQISNSVPDFPAPEYSSLANSAQENTHTNSQL